MKILTTKTYLIFLLLFLGGTLFSQVPDGGILLNSQSGSYYQKIGNCTLTEVAVADQDFATALNAVTGTDITNNWDAQIKFTAVAGIETNDIVLVAFYCPNHQL